MTLVDRIKLALRAFRASPAIFNVQNALYEDASIGQESKTILGASQENFYKNSSFVYACIRRRMDAVARPPLYVFKRGESSPQLEHPLQKLLNKPTPFHTRSTLQRRVELALCTWGNALVGIERDKLGKPYEAWWMRPDGITVVPSKKNFIDHYEYNVGGEVSNWNIDEILHFKYDDPFNQTWGLTPLNAARLTAEFGIDAITSNRYFFHNYAMPAIGLVTKEPVTATQAKEILDRWNASLAGATKQHKTMVLGAVDPKPLTVTPKDAEWLAGMKFALDDIARIFGVPSPLVGEEKAVYRNISEAEASFWRETIIPELLYFEEIFNEGLVPLYKEAGIYVAYDITVVEALREDANTTATRHGLYVDKGIKTINEVREELGKPPVAWGSVWYMPMNLFPVGSSSDAKNITPPSETTKTQSLSLRALDINEQTHLFFDFFESEKNVIAEAYTDNLRALNSYDWSRWYKTLGVSYAKQAQGVYRRAINDTTAQTKVTISFELANKRAEEWANRYVLELLGESKRYPQSITEETRRTLERLIDTSLKAGESVNDIRAKILENPIFSEARAEMIARTETQRAYNKGNIEGYKLSGVVKAKRWQGGRDCCDECAINSDAKEVDLEDNFPSGDSEPPAHPNCLCYVSPVIKE
jgi:HK97 family phage portal protein